MLDMDDKVSMTVYIWTIQLAMLNSCFNPILYAFTNTQFKKGFIKLFKILFYIKKKASIPVRRS